MKRLLLLVCLPLHAFKLGVENISPEVIKRLQSGRVGLVTNQTGVDQQGRRAIDVLTKKNINVVALYVPEHGMEGTIKAGHDVPTVIDTITKVPIISLYKHGAGKIAPRAFDGVDMIAIDLQDVGMRHYTYISTLFIVMEECARQKKPVFVFDRPNVLGSVMEGPICMPELRSFIGIAEIPLRHGMTMGELAQFFNTKRLTRRVELTVVPLRGYRRDMQLSHLLAHLSPNIKTLESAQGYSFLGLVGEVGPFHVGVGSQDAFQVIMLPQDLKVSKKAWHELQQGLIQHGITSSCYTIHHSEKKKWYEGLRISIDNVNEVSSFKAFMTVLAWTQHHNVPISFMPTFDKSVGTSAVRQWYQSKKPFDSFMQVTKQKAEEFLDLNRDVLLYDTCPKVVRAIIRSDKMMV